MLFLQKETFRWKQRETLSLKDCLRKPSVTLTDLLKGRRIGIDLSDEEIRHIESEVKYEGYIQKQAKEIEKIRRIDQISIPADLDFQKVSGLSLELKEKLAKLKPSNLGEANKIPGMTPAGLINLQIHIKIKKQAALQKKKHSTAPVKSPSRLRNPAKGKNIL